MRLELALEPDPDLLHALRLLPQEVVAPCRRQVIDVADKGAPRLHHRAKIAAQALHIGPVLDAAAEAFRAVHELIQVPANALAHGDVDEDLGRSPLELLALDKQSFGLALERGVGPVRGLLIGEKAKCSR